MARKTSFKVPLLISISSMEPPKRVTSCTISPMPATWTARCPLTGLKGSDRSARYCASPSWSELFNRHRRRGVFLFEIVRRVVGDNPAVIDDRHLVADFGLVHVMGGQKYGDALLLLEFPDVVPSVNPWSADRARLSARQGREFWENAPARGRSRSCASSRPTDCPPGHASSLRCRPV